MLTLANARKGNVHHVLSSAHARSLVMGSRCLYGDLMVNAKVKRRRVDVCVSGRQDMMNIPFSGVRKGEHMDYVFLGKISFNSFDGRIDPEDSYLMLR